MPRALPIILFSLYSLVLQAQNLVPNPSFEDYSFCPGFFGMGGDLLAIPWQNGNATTSDYFNACDINIVDVPDNALGWQYAHTGDGYTGTLTKSWNLPWIEYIQVQLTSALIADQLYKVSFYTNVANYFCAIQSIGAHLSDSPPTPNGGDALLVDPQIVNTSGYITDTLNWTLIEGFYVAQGGEQWITIGNFELDANTILDPMCMAGPTPQSYYYYDDVSVVTAEPCGELDVDLGDDVEVCFEYTIDPGLGDYHYVWSTGSTDPTITVTESGVYGLTITDSCRVGMDHIEVIVLGNIPVDLGPDSIMLCEGESFEIELDDAYGEYVWQDGSDDPNYVIDASGVYSVLYDDGCAQSTDTIVADVLPLPLPFSIGPDTLLCDDDEFDISLDPSLGEFEWSDGSNASSFTVDEAGSYALTISNVCGEETDDLEVEHGESPYVEFGPDAVTICMGETVSFEFDEEEGTYVWQDGMVTNLYNITLPGLYSVTVTNGCGSYDDALLVTLSPGPQIDLGQDQVVCPAQLPDTLDVSSAGGATFTWQDGSTLSQFIVNAAGAFSVTVTNTCGTSTDSISYVVNEILPAVILQHDTVVCEGDTVWLYNSGDTGVPVWQDGSTSDSLLVISSGTYSLQVTTICGTGSDSVNVQFSADTLYPNLGPDIALCPGEIATLYAGNGFEGYLWQDLSAADSFVVSSAGEFYVMVSNACGVGTDMVIVTVSNNPPHLDLIDSVSLCAGAQLVLDANISGVSYLWSDGSDQSTLTVSSPGQYSVTVSNNCGIDVDTVTVANGGALPFLEIGDDIQLCEGEVQTITPTFTNVDQWLWYDGSADSTFTASGVGAITVAVSNACGTSYDTLYVELFPDIPPLNLGNDTALCESTTLTLLINHPEVSIAWQDGSTGNSFTIEAPGVYFASIENECGIASDTILITSIAAPALDLGEDQSLCAGEVILLDPGIPDVQYLWQDGSTSPSYSTTTGDTIVLTVSNVCGAATDSLIVVETTEGQQLDLGPDINGCAGETAIVQAGISGVDYEWQDGSTGDAFTATQSGLVILQVTNNCGTDIDTVYVDLSGISPATSLGADTTICEGSTLLLQSTASPGTIITWQDGSADESFLVQNGGTFFIHEANACGENADTMVIDMQSPPSPFSLGPDVILCPGETTTLTAPNTTDEITWQDGSHVTVFEASLAQLYTLQIANACGAAIDSFVLAFDSNAPVIDTGSVLICPGDAIVLDVSQPGATYSWSTGSQEASITVQVPDQYAVTIITSCFEVSGVIPVVASDDCKPKTTYYIPNIFSPNGDQVNDSFGIYFNEDAIVIGIEGDIFDRWGNHVFASQAIPFRWDGAFNRKPMNPGVYVYRFVLTYSNGANIVTEKLTGDVTLLR